ncbi:MAG: ArsA family ATPase [Chrysiogenetes bacterium]|nr:ArsA family ATPase [Chrysiogenetes bacterium]
MKPAEWIANRSVVVCSGPGGVGKTTVSASIALAEAKRGRKVLVLTIDPARRLANALGLESFGAEARQVPKERFIEQGETFEGELYAMMLDTKAEWDAVMTRYAPDSSIVSKILDNRMYKYLSDNLVGAQEFMAMERLYHLHNEGDYDLIVLDTPPTKHALDFLEAPKKLFQFLEDGTFVRVFIDTGRSGGMRLLRVGTTAVFKVLERIIGSSVIHDISEFVSSLEGYYEGFRVRARATNDLLQSEKALFLLVTAPTPLALSETRYFHQRLIEAKIPFGGFIFNRVHSHYLESETHREAAEKLSNEEDRVALRSKIEKDPALGEQWAGLTEALAQNFANLETLAELEAKKIGSLTKLLDKDQFVVRVPMLDHEIHDSLQLDLVNDHIFGETIQ